MTYSAGFIPEALDDLAAISLPMRDRILRKIVASQKL